MKTINKNNRGSKGSLYKSFIEQGATTLSFHPRFIYGGSMDMEERNQIISELIGMVECYFENVNLQSGNFMKKIIGILQAMREDPLESIDSALKNAGRVNQLTEDFLRAFSEESERGA